AADRRTQEAARPADGTARGAGPTISAIDAPVAGRHRHGRQHPGWDPEMRTFRFFLVLVALGAVAGCNVPSLADLPLPGGAPSGPAYHVIAEVSDVTGLGPSD